MLGFLIGCVCVYVFVCDVLMDFLYWLETVPKIKTKNLCHIKINGTFPQLTYVILFCDSSTEKCKWGSACSYFSAHFIRKADDKYKLLILLLFCVVWKCCLFYIKLITGWSHIFFVFIIHNTYIVNIRTLCN